MVLLRVFLFYLILNVLSNRTILHRVLANVVKKKLKKNHNEMAFLTIRQIINERRTPQSGIPRSRKNLTYKHYFTTNFNALPETTSKYVPCCSPATSKTAPSATELSTTRPDKSTTFIVSPASTFST